MGKGTYFMSQDIYIKQFQEKLHFKPFVGTLNIKLEKMEEHLLSTFQMKNLD
jgi:CTP-dependent riboflavin kinase